MNFVANDPVINYQNQRPAIKNWRQGFKLTMANAFNGVMNKSYLFDPRITLRSYLKLRNCKWEELDREASLVLGKESLAVPSIRVGILWVLEYLGFNRHDTDVLVPNFLSRCILNTINRRAFPVTAITPKTRLAVLVQQFGFRQNYNKIKDDLARNQIVFIEDSPYGIGYDEELLPNSMGKFIGFPKVLPILKGAAFLSNNKSLIAFMKEKRKQRAWFSWIIFWVLAITRIRKHMKFSIFNELAYELYVHSPSDNIVLRNNFYEGLLAFEDYRQNTQQKVDYLNDKLKNRVAIPEGMNLLYQVPYFAREEEGKVAQIFARNNFDPIRYHFDINHNIFDPKYEEIFLIPMNPTIPDQAFKALINELSSLGDE